MKFAFNKWTLGEEFCTRRAEAHAPSSSTTRSFDLLPALGFAQEATSTPPTSIVCGAMTLEGAPHLKAEH